MPFTRVKAHPHRRSARGDGSVFDAKSLTEICTQSRPTCARRSFSMPHEIPVSLSTVKANPRLYGSAWSRVFVRCKARVACIARQQSWQADKSDPAIERCAHPNSVDRHEPERRLASQAPRLNVTSFT
jgi:hypothetical protein